MRGAGIRLALRGRIGTALGAKERTAVLAYPTASDWRRKPRPFRKTKESGTFRVEWSPRITYGAVSFARASMSRVEIIGPKRCATRHPHGRVDSVSNLWCGIVCVRFDVEGKNTWS